MRRNVQKKALTAERHKADVAAAGQNRRELPPRLDSDKLGFIDETGTSAALLPPKRGPTSPRPSPAWSLADHDLLRWCTLHYRYRIASDL